MIYQAVTTTAAFDNLATMSVARRATLSNAGNTNSVDTATMDNEVSILFFFK